MNDKQELAIRRLCSRYRCVFIASEWREAGTLDGLPEGYYVGTVGNERNRLYVGVSPEGHISS